MTVTVTGVVDKVNGSPDRSKWIFASPTLRESGDGDSVVSTNLIVATPNTEGVLTVELDPGPVLVRYGNTAVTVTVPDADIELWDLIGAGINLPPATADEKIAAAVAAYMEAHPFDLLDLDEWEWYANLAAFPVTGVTDVVYGARDTGNFYRWSGSAYVNLSQAATAYATMAALKASTAAANTPVLVSGYYAAGDGGGGVFRWDATDTTSTDNGGTIITPSGALASVGRWKRVYEGEVNARWFGAHPGATATQNTAAFQAAIDWIQDDETRNPSGGYGSGTLFIPMGYYRVNGPCTVSENYVQIRGEGPGTMLTVREHAYPSTMDYLFIFAASYKAIGWGVRDLCINGNSMLKWAIKLDTCHSPAFENVLVSDVHGGSLYAESTLTGNCGENVLVRHVDYNSTSSNPATGCLTKNNIVFKSTSGASWSDCEIEDCMAVGIWDYGVVLDGVIRFKVNKCDVSLNYSSPNTIDGTTHAGVHGAVKITHTVNGTWSSANGQHVIDGVYHESHEGTEDVVNYCAVAIESPSGGGGYNRGNRVYNVNTSWNVPLAPALFKVTNVNGVDGQVIDNHFTANRRPLSHNQIQIGALVRDTHLNLAPNLGLLRTIKVYDSGIRTRINGIISAAYRNAATYPDNTVTSAEVDVGEIYRDTVTGRTVLQDQYNDSVVIGPRPGLDVVSPYGAQRIQALPTPAAPRVTPIGTGSTTWTYYVVAIDKDGNKTPPSPAGTTTAGPASLTSSTYNAVQWFPVEGAVKYDLLRGATSTSIATNLVTTHYDDPGTSTSAYTPSAVSPPGNLTIDGALALAGVNTVGNGGTLAFHNQTDQITNYERVRHFWTSNRYFIYSEIGGSGTLRPIEIRSRGGIILWQTPIAPATGTIQLTDSTSTANTAIVGVNGTLSAASIGAGVQVALSVSPTMNQSSTAGYAALLINVTETATGSGTKRLIDIQVAGASKFYVDNAGNALILGTLEFGNASDTTLARSGAGDLTVEGNAIYRAGGTDVPVTDGGTGSSTAAGARTNLGLAIGSDVQAFDADLATVAGLTATTDNFLQAKASAWASRTPTQVTADLIAFVGDSGSGGTKGMVPAPTTGDATKFLKGNGTWATLAGGGDALVANPLSQFAATTSAQLRGVLSDETGTGAAVFADSPTLITPALGTPSAAVLTNATGLPASGLVASTSQAVGFGTIELGHVTDTTVSRSAAGKIAVEGVDVVLLSGAQTITGKTLTSPVINTPTGIVKGDVGLGNVDNTSNATERAATRTLTNARVTKRIGTTASSATPTPDADSHDQYNVTALAAGATFGAPTGTPTDGQKLTIRIKDNATAQTLAYNAIYRALGVTLPTTTVISKTLYIGCIFNSADTKWDVLAVGVEA